MKQDRQLLEDNLNLILEDYSNDNKIMEEVVLKLIGKGIPRGRTTGLLTKAIPLNVAEEVELSLLSKYIFAYTHEAKINPDEWFNEIELKAVETYQKNKEDKVNYILLYNVDEIIPGIQYLCTKETYQNIGKYMGNGLLTYNPNTQRQPLRRKVGDRIVESVNVDGKKVDEISISQINDTFSVNAIIWNVRRVNGQEKIYYDFKKRTLLIEPDNVSTFVDILDGFHRTCGMLKTIEKKADIDRLTSIYIHHVDEERANAIIRQEAKATPINTEWVEVHNSANLNMEVAKAVNLKPSKNEMFNRVAVNVSEIRLENKLVTFETLSKAIEFVYDLNDKKVPVIQSQVIEKHLIELFNIIIGINHDEFNEYLPITKESSYLADNNMFIGYIVLGKEMKDKFGKEWDIELTTLLNSINFSKENPIWAKIGIENNINLSTIKKISNYFKSLVPVSGKEAM